MKNKKINLCLADFENELENLNHSEMKELVGGAESYSGIGGGGGCETMTVIGYQNSSNFGGYSSFSMFASSYPSSPVTSSGSIAGGGGGSSAPSAQGAQCVNEFDREVKSANGTLRTTLTIALISGIKAPQMLPYTISGSVAAYAMSSYSAAMSLRSCLN